jgi:hypothetical protein
MSNLEEQLKLAEALAKRDKERDAIEARAHKRAMEILETGDARAFILETFKTQHIGDDETAEGMLIGTANQSVANSKGIQPAVFGESGRGKSHAARAMLHLHPKRYFMIASLSDKALFYLEAGALCPGMTIFSDDARLSEGIEDLIKRATAFFQEKTINKVPQKEGGKWTTKDLEIPPRINWLLTSVNSQGSEQLVNRQLGFDVDETPEQDERVTDFELAKARDGRPEFEITEEVLICRELISTIKEDEKGQARLFTVKIPYAERIEWLDKTNRRNLPLFLDLIKGYAMLNFKQREIIDNVLIATEADFHAAERLYNRRGGFQKLHINEGEKRMLMYIVENGGELTTDGLMRKLKLSRSRVRQLADRLETVLPGFKVEKRTEHARDVYDDDKSTATQHNYYCYTGAVTVDIFGSVVSLRGREKKEHLQSAYTSDTGNYTGDYAGPEHENEKAQNEDLLGKEAIHNKIIDNKEVANRALAANQGVYTRARVYSQDSTVSDPNSPPSDGSETSICGIESSAGLDAHVQVTCNPSVSGLALAIKNTLASIKCAGGNIDGGPSTIANVIAIRIKSDYLQWRDFDVLSFFNTLVENDSEIQDLIADLTRGSALD